MTSNHSALLRVAQAAKWLGISVPKLYRKVKEGTLPPPFYKQANSVAWLSHELDSIAAAIECGYSIQEQKEIVELIIESRGTAKDNVLMKSQIPQITFNEIVERVVNTLICGQKVTIAELNQLIPVGMNKSAQSIIRRIQEENELELSYQRSKKGNPAYWYVTELAAIRYSFYQEENKKVMAERAKSTSQRIDTSCLKSIRNRRGMKFIIDNANI